MYQYTARLVREETNSGGQLEGECGTERRGGANRRAGRRGGEFWRVSDQPNLCESVRA